MLISLQYGSEMPYNLPLPRRNISLTCQFIVKCLPLFVLGYLVGFFLCEHTCNTLKSSNVVDTKTVVTIRTTANPTLYFYNDTSIFNPNNHVFTYVTKNEPTCDRNVFLLIVVISSVSHWDRRQEIRQTWKKGAEKLSETVRVVFLLGKQRETNVDIEEQLKQESEHYQDIILGNFIDSYFNLTLKSLSMINWMKSHCHQAQHLMKIDDDVTLVPKSRLIKILKYRKKKSGSNFIMGFKLNYHRNTNPYHKWYDPTSLNYNGTFLSGPSYVISGDVIDRLWASAMEIPLFHLEDVYVTGMLAGQAGVKLYHTSSFCNGVDPDKKARKSCITVHKLS